MKWMRMGLGSLMVLALLGLEATAVGAQIGVAGSRGCADELISGDLGISGLDCRGDCTLTMNEKGEELFWSFTAEPRVTSLARGGPADGVLQAGDEIVAIDGILITTAAGGRRFANVDPGEDVRIRFRRNGRAAEAVLHAVSGCPAIPPAAPDVAAPLVGRLPPLPPEPDEARAGARVGVAPRVRMARGAAMADSARAPFLEARGVAAVTLEPPSRAGLGINFSCSECGSTTDDETGETTWYFSGPVEIIGVDPNGPAARAGIQIGDLIEAIDGHEIQTEAGGRAFSALEAGEPVALTVVKRNGRERTVEVVPEERTRVARGVAAAPLAEAAVPDALPEPRGIGVSVTPPVAPDRAAYPAPVIEAPPGLPLRWSGSMEGVEIEVRGEPIRLMEMRGARTIIINSDGLWIRIRIPAGGEG